MCSLEPYGPGTRSAAGASRWCCCTAGWATQQTSRPSSTRWPPASASWFRSDVPERRGHGHTADVDGPITYQLMAQDTIAWFTDRRLVKLDPDLRGYAAYMFATEGQVVQIPGS
jgi:hypothetical protein